MPLNSLSVGRDCTVQVFDPNAGGVVTLKNITAFEAKPTTIQLKSKGLNGIVIHATEPDGWSGSFMIDRNGANVDRLFALLEANYYNGINIQSQTITETIQEADGTISQYQFIGVALTYSEAGQWTNGKQVSQKIDWNASQRILKA